MEEDPTMKALEKKLERMTKRQAQLNVEIRDRLEALATKAQDEVRGMDEDRVPTMCWIQSEVNGLNKLLAQKEEIARADMMLRQIRSFQETLGS
jgi:hypothetical protein